MASLAKLHNRRMKPRGVPNFSFLPEVVLVKVLQFLDVTDRYHLSLTCSTLHALFDHPRVWSCVTLDLYYDEDGQMMKARDTKTRDKTGTGQAAAFLKFQPQSVILSLQSAHGANTRLLSAEELDVLTDLLTKVHLKSLTVKFELDLMYVTEVHINKSKSSVSRLLEELCTQSPGEIHVELTVTDPLGVGSEYCDHSATELYRQKPKTWFSRVTKFELPTLFLSDKEVWEKLPQLTSSPTAVLLSRFPSLRCLSLSAVNLSDQLLYQLADTSRAHCALRSLAIQHFRDRDDDPLGSEEDGEVPELSSAAWCKLVTVCPRLQVSCHISASVVQRDLLATIKPETPVVGVTLWGSCDEGLGLVSSLCVEHSTSLQTFVYECCCRGCCECSEDHRPRLPDSVLVSMAMDCPQLQHLVYDGEIHPEDIIQLAQLDRRWRTFVFRDDYILIDHETDIHQGKLCFQDKQKLDNGKDRHHDKPCFQDKQKLDNGKDRHQDIKETCQAALDDLYTAVSQLLGYAWTADSKYCYACCT
ncbi:uncharacterized protein [Littorina saxatilis]|uniref:F-box domain-containing protein n=1 Tax=Littorina saxatilis TaxID=31220 RepID=A0AAN9G7Z5_9CAEN